MGSAEAAYLLRQALNCVTLKINHLLCRWREDL